MTNLVSQTLHVLQSSSKTAKGLIEARDLDVVADLSRTLTSQITDTQALVLSLQQEQSAFIAKISELEKQISEFDEWETEKQRYQMEKLDPGLIVYVLKEGSNTKDPPHNLCAVCYNNSKKSVLQVVSHNSGLTRWRCYDCGFNETSGRSTAFDNYSTQPINPF